MILNVRKTRKRKCKSQMGFETTTLHDPVGCSNHWANGDSMVRRVNLWVWTGTITRPHSQVMTGTQELTNSISHMIGIILSCGSNNSPPKKKKKKKKTNNKNNNWNKKKIFGSGAFLEATESICFIVLPALEALLVHRGVTSKHAMAPTGDTCVSSVREKVSYPSTQRHEPRQL